MSAFIPNLLIFGRLLRAAGLDVPVGSVLTLIEGLTHVDLSVREDVFHACRAVLVRVNSTLSPGATDSMTQVLPPITAPFPITVSPPRMVAPE